MDILIGTHFLNGYFMILIPIGLGIYLTHRFKLGWRLWWIGGITFILSQVGHIPFNIASTALFKRGILPMPPEDFALIFNALVLGLSAAVWEEGARYLSYWYWAVDARSWSKGVLMGAGHGGIEAIILGFLTLVTLANMVAVQNMDLNTLVPSGQLELVQEQLNFYWSLPRYAPMLGALERSFAIIFHIAASVIVLQVFLRKQIRWLLFAIVLHTVLNALAVYTLSTWGAYTAEVIIGVMALICLAIIFLLRPEHKEYSRLNGESVQTAEAAFSTGDINLPEIEESSENLEASRYT